LWRRQVLLLTTRGRKSGLERTVPLQFFPDGEDMIVVAANSGLPSPPGWYFNLTADPSARVEVGGRALQTRAEELSAEEAAAFWPRVLRVAPDYAKYPRRTSRRIPVVRLVPVGPGDEAPLRKRRQYSSAKEVELLRHGGGLVLRERGDVLEATAGHAAVHVVAGAA
jgi:deazaflavin-dependent oxidoreductase (nitroreductase family)